MSHWTDEFETFNLSDNGRKYSAIGKKDNLLDIDALDIIRILENIAFDENNGSNKIKALGIEYCRIKDDLDIGDTNTAKVKRGKDYIELPNIELSFVGTVFDSSVSFGFARFKEKNIF